MTPEFEIALSYHWFPNPNGSFLTGWKYSLHWTDDRGNARTHAKFGHDTKGLAKQAAEEVATRKALAMLGTEIYKFTPKVD